MNVAVVKVGKVQSGKFSNEYQCVKVVDIDTQKVYTLNIGSMSSEKFKPFLKKGNIFYNVETRIDNPKVIDVFKGYSNVTTI